MQHSMILVFLLALVPQERYETPEMRSLADAERAFAARSVEKGSREAFVENFADDGIAFQPHPVVYRDAVKDRPVPANPKALTLDWRPVFGDVSESGDLGYTTGPYSLVDNSGNQPTRFGFYFSVWKKNSPNRWKVALDIGITTPDPFTGSDDFRQAAAIRKRSSAGTRAGSGKNELEKAEEDFSRISASQGVAAAHESYLGADCRLHVEDRHPFIGKEAIKGFVTGNRSSKSLFTAVSRSDDLGYTYGSYETMDNSNSAERGYFCHVWKRNDLGRWKIVAEILNAVPPEKP